MPKLQVNLSELAKAAGGVRQGMPAAAPVEEKMEEGQKTARTRQKSRENTVPITVQQPEEVRTQLKMLALEQRDTLENKVAEALNDLFAKYRKPEIAVIKKRKGRAA